MFKIKNLDTGEEEVFGDGEDDEEDFSNKIFSGLHSTYMANLEINQQNPWKNFWLHVEKNN